MEIPKLNSVNLKREPTTREKIIFLAVLVASLILFMDMLWKPASAKIHALKTDLEAQEQQADALKKLIDATQMQMNKTTESVDKVAPIDPYVKKVVERKIVDVAEEVNSTADLMRDKKFANKADVLNVVIGDKTQEGDFTRIPITVEMRGRYSPIKEYLESLENIGRPLIVESFQADKPEIKSNELSVKIQTALYIPKA